MRIGDRRLAIAVGKGAKVNQLAILGTLRSGPYSGMNSQKLAGRSCLMTAGCEWDRLNSGTALVDFRSITLGSIAQHKDVTRPSQDRLPAGDFSRRLPCPRSAPRSGWAVPGTRCYAPGNCYALKA